MNKKKYNVVTLFSGYDSQCLALDRLGLDYDLVAWSEIDRNAIKAHNVLYPQWADRNVGDVSKVDWTTITEPIDLLTYSSPCQDFSTAGLQRGGEAGSGTRSSLLWEVERAIVALRPRYLLLENVANLVGKKFYPLFMRWCKVLEGYGYHNTWQIMNAKDFGVPQNRKRVFLVSTLDQKPYYFPKPFELKKKLKDVLEKNVDERYYLSDERVEGLLKSTLKEKNAGRGFEFMPKTGEENYSNSVTTNAGGRKTDNFIIEPRCLQVGNIVSTGNFENPQRGRVYDVNGISPCLNTETGGGFRPKIVVDEDINDVSGKDKSTDVAVSEENIDNSYDAENNWNISEPSILTPKRTEYGKSVRKKYGDYNIPESRHNLTVLEPRQDGTSNTITTVAKDNLLAEPDFHEQMVVIGSMQKNAFVGPIDGVSPCINAACGMGGGQTPMVTEEIRSTIISPGHGYFNGAENAETCPTVKRSAMQEQHFVKEQEVLGWTRDSQGNIIDRHPVNVANCVTASKRDNTQNYVKEQVFLNGDSDGCACTITTTHDYSGNIINPKGGHKQMGVMEIVEDFYTSREPRHYTENSPTIRSEREGLKVSNRIRVRKLTERELYRLMDVDEKNIDKLLASDIARTQHAKLAGNSIVVGCLYHIFDKMFLDKDVPTGEQTRLF